MPKATFGSVLRFLGRQRSAHGADTWSDDELLHRFVAHGETDAFTILVERHGPMVLGVCHRVLGDFHLAEDSFQATFIVLARKAASLGLHGSLGTWLYAVAQRIALRVKAQTTVRLDRERRHPNVPRSELLDEVTWKELRSVLDEEIGRLPEKYRAPLVLCYFEGKSQERVAQELGLAKGTLARRLLRGRELLRQQLLRRGITLSVGVLTTVLCDKVAGAPITARLALSTVKVVASVISGKAEAAGCLSVRAVALAEEAMTGMLGNKGTLILVGLVLGLAMSGVYWAGYRGLAQTPAPAPVALAQPVAAKDPEMGPTKQNQPGAADQHGDPLPPGALARLGTVRFRNDSDAYGLVFSPDGKILVGNTGSGVIIWDAATGKERQRLPIRIGRLGSGGGLDISPDGNMLALAESFRPEDSAQISLWDLRSGKKTRMIPVPASVDPAIARELGQCSVSRQTEKLWQ